MLDLFPDSARIERGELVVGDIRAGELAERFGTPLVVYCEDTIRARAREVRAAVPEAAVFYGSKAFPNVAIMRVLAEEGIGADVASLGELAFARAAGIDGERLIVHGNAKSDDELRAAAEAGALVALDTEGEAARAAAAGVVRVLVRATLGVEADTHDAIRTGHHGSKFGLPPAAVVRTVADARSLALEVAGLHVHVGSQLPDTSSHEETIELLAALAARCRDELGWEPELVDVGGGFGVRHVLEEPAVSLREAAVKVADAVSRAWDAHGLRAPKLMLEPGRALVGTRRLDAVPRPHREAARRRDVGGGRRGNVGQPPPRPVRRPLHGTLRRARRRADDRDRERRRPSLRVWRRPHRRRLSASSPHRRSPRAAGHGRRTRSR